MSWMLERAVPMRQFFGEPKTYVKMMDKKTIRNFTLRSFANLNIIMKYRTEEGQKCAICDTLQILV